MSKRNFILLTIILTIIVILFFGYLYFAQKSTTPGESESGINFLSQFNPFSTKSTTTEEETKTPTDVSEYIPEEEKEEPVLEKVSSMPIAGFVVYKKERLKELTPEEENTETENKKPTPPATELVSALRYVDRVNGNIYQTFVDKIEERRFTDNIIPKIYEAYLGNNGESAILRYLKTDYKTIITFLGKTPKEILGGDETTANELTGTFLPENIRDMSISKDKKNIFYLFDFGENIIGTTLNLETGKKTQVFDSPFTEWLSQWPNEKLITLTTKASFRALGYMYSIDPTSTKVPTQVLGKINGLTTLTSPDGKFVLFGNNNLNLGIYDINTKTSDTLGIRTMPEKCVWSADSLSLYCGVPKTISGGEYPDSWYKGKISFNDQFWKVDVATGSETFIVDPVDTEEREEFDSIKLSLDETENYLFFVNKKDSYLWKLKLK